MTPLGSKADTLVMGRQYTKEVRTSGDRDDPGGYRRLAAIEGRGIHKASKAKNNDVLFRIPINHYFSTRYTEMLVAEAYSLRYKKVEKP